jgi:hypothetical protein
MAAKAGPLARHLVAATVSAADTQAGDVRFRQGDGPELGLFIVISEDGKTSVFTSGSTATGGAADLIDLLARLPCGSATPGRS